MKLASSSTAALSWAHPLTRDWFLAKFGSPTEPQEQGWPAILAGKTTLISAPTGSGKTLAAFLACIDKLVRKAVAHELKNETSVVYVSPLKALSNDIQKNLDGPLAEIKELAESRGVAMAEIRTAVRTGDTPTKERQAMLKNCPHILVTTPESLYILLTADKSRQMLSTVETLIVDEIHAVADDKRGAHLSLTLERLCRLTRLPPNRIGLSATQKPIELVAEFLSGGSKQKAVIVNIGHRRQMDIAIEVPKMPLQPVAPQELSTENFDRIAQLVKEHRSTLVFVNTRKQAERFALQLGARLGEQAVACHHGSLSRHVRLAAEQRLKDGDIQVLIATASLELGIDIGFIDLVIQVSSVKTIATALQRVGRAGHWRGAIPKGRFFPYTRDELVETAALVRAINHGDLDKLEIPECPVDILAQQIVAMAAVEDLEEEPLYEEIKQAYPYRNLTREKFTSVIEMLADGISARRGRYGAYLLRDQVNGVLKARRGARLAAITSGGAIPETAIYGVVEEPDGKNVGTLDEHFAIDSHRGDIFTLGSTSWRIRRIDNVGGKVYVEDAHGAPPSVPFWFGEAPARSDELSRQVSDLRENISRLTQNTGLEYSAHTSRTEEVQTAVDWLKAECGVDDSGAEQLIEYMVQGRAVLTAVPTVKRVVAERFFDEGGGMQLILHAPFGGRINRAWGLALRKKFCRSFNLELQAAATEDGISIALAEQHSFPLGDVFYFLARETVRHTLEQASLQSPIFATRWRWDAMRSLALLRFQGGKKVQPYLQRLRSDDLLAAVFPAAAACQDNNPGDVELPDHPLIAEVMKDVLTEAMDVEGLESIIDDIKSGAIECVAVDTPTPSQFAAEIINANVYAYLDDAGVEERRTRAVQMRRIMPGSVTGELGQLDPAAIDKVVEQAFPDIQNADELHDLMQTTFVMPEDSTLLSRQPKEIWQHYFDNLRQQKRATLMTVGQRSFWVNAEKVETVKVIFPAATFAEPLKSPGFPPEKQLAVLNCLRGWVPVLGPVLVQDVVDLLCLDEREVEIAFAQMEADGAILRGEFTGRKKLSTQITGIASLPLTEYEWCERRLLARIHKLTLATLRKGVEPVTAGVYARWLTHWQHLAPGAQLAGERGLLQILKQLQGYEIPANAWESQVLAQRVKNYSPDLLDSLCMKGTIGWGRLSIHPALALATEAVPREDSDMRSAFLAHSDGENKYSPENFKTAKDNKVTAFRKKKKEKDKDAVVAEESATYSSEAQVINIADAGLIKRVVPSSVAPIAFYIRDDADWMTTLAKTPDKIDLSGLSTAAKSIEQFLRQRGASFFADIVRGTALTKSQTELGLWELVTAGLVSADGFENLRSLIDPDARDGHRPGKSKRFRDFNYGRWTLLHAHNTIEKSKGLESMCRVLLGRYGVVFRDVVQRESNLPPWRELLAAFRQMEDKGEVRGGRFVLGFIGEQFALPEAVDSLRAAKNKESKPVTITASAADPLNLIGTLLPGDRIPAASVKPVEISC